MPWPRSSHPGRPGCRAAGPLAWSLLGPAVVGLLLSLSPSVRAQAAAADAIGASDAAHVAEVADVAGGFQELGELRLLLESWSHQPDWPHMKAYIQAHPLSISLESDPTPEISSRLALFRTRFGCDFRDCPGWREISREAALTYERLRHEYPEPEPGSTRFGDEWLGPAWVGVRALLLDIAGRSDEARTLLFGDGERYWPGCCPYCLSESVFYVARARAEFLDRAGDPAGALQWLHEACYECDADEMGGVFGRPRPASDLVKARYAILLADAGELAAAAGEVDALEKQQPGSLGLSVARAALADRLPETSTVTVFAVPLYDGTDGDWSGAGMAFIAGAARDAMTWHLLAVRLPKHPEKKLDSRLAPDCGSDLVLLAPTDARVSPFVETCLDQPAGWRWAQALRVAQALGTASRSRLITCLKQTDVEEHSGRSQQRIDQAARIVSGGGPDLGTTPEALSLAELRDAWLAWLQ